MDLGTLLDTCNWYDKWQFSADLFDSNIRPNYAPLRDIRLRNLSDPDSDLSSSLKVKCDNVFGLPIYAINALLLMFNSNIWPNSALLQNKRNRKFEWSWIGPFKVTQCQMLCHWTVHMLPLMFNSNIWPNSAPLRNIRLRNLSHLEFDLSRSLKVICNSVFGLSIYAFLLCLIVT